MRAGPLSKPDVIDTLNRHFVPAYTSMEDYHEGGAAPPEEKAAYRKIYLAALESKLSAGSVHAYVVTPDGKPIDSLHVAQAAAGTNLLDMLNRAVKRLDVPAGEPVVKPKSQAACPDAEDQRNGGLVLHLVSRAEGTGPGGGSWHGFPGENWVVLSREEAAKFLPPAGGAAAWEIDRAAASKVLTHFYPQTENNDVSTNRIDRVSLKATLLPNDGEATRRARIDGTLRMKHTFYPKREDNRFVDARIVGYLEFDPAAGRVKTLALTTDGATYGDTKFDVAVRSAEPAGR